MVEKTRKSVTKELEVCHDCAEYGGHFCDDCIEEIQKMKKEQDLLEYTKGTRMDDAYYYFKPEDTIDGKEH